MIFLQMLILFSLLYATIFGQDPSTWKTIQEKIFDINCIMCHYEGSSFAEQSGLVLTPDVSYVNLIDILPKNEAAKNEGLVRVSSEGSQPALEKSFLWGKINAPDQAHFYEDHPGYGSIMPLGLPSLTNGELSFIMIWILEEAPETGVVADENLLNDTTRYELAAFQPLDPPENGLQLHLGPFEVQPHELYDREFFYYQPLNLSEDIFINRVEISMRPGSHHFILYTFDPDIPSSLMPQPETYRDMYDHSGNYNPAVLLQMLYHRFFSGTQTPYLNYHFPPNVALHLPAGTGLDLNSHYINHSENVIEGEVYTNLYTVDESEVKRIAEILFLNNTDINLPPGDTTTIVSEFLMDSRLNLFQMWSHSHEHTLEFRIEKADTSGSSRLIYFSRDWQHPPILRLDPPMIINPGEKIRLLTTYYNWTDSTINFGPLGSDEMQILFGMYYRGEPLTDVETGKEVPSGFSLEQNYPNPFNPSTSIEYRVVSLPAGKAGIETVTLKIYDILGNEVVTLVNEEKPAGIYKLTWNAANLPSGVYFYQLRAGNFTQTKKLILMK